MKDRLADAIARLPEREKLVVALYYYENLTLREIGEVLGVTESRVSQLHTKAVLRLKSRLQGDPSRSVEDWPGHEPRWRTSWGRRARGRKAARPSCGSWPTTASSADVDADVGAAELAIRRLVVEFAGPAPLRTGERGPRPEASRRPPGRAGQPR